MPFVGALPMELHGIQELCSPAKNHPQMLTTLGCPGTPEQRNSSIDKFLSRESLNRGIPELRLTILLGSAQGALNRGIPQQLRSLSAEEFLGSEVFGHPRVVSIQGWFLAGPSCACCRSPREAQKTTHTLVIKMITCNYQRAAEGGGKLGGGGGEHTVKPLPKTSLDPPICDTFPPPPFWRLSVISLKGKRHRLDQPQFLRPSKVVLESTLRSTFPPPPQIHVIRSAPPPPSRCPKLCLFLGINFLKITITIIFHP